MPLFRGRLHRLPERYLRQTNDGRQRQQDPALRAERAQRAQRQRKFQLALATGSQSQEPEAVRDQSACAPHRKGKAWTSLILHSLMFESTGSPPTAGSIGHLSARLPVACRPAILSRSEEHTSELQSLRHLV